MRIIKLYNYDYSDIFTFPCPSFNEEISIESNVYPTKLEVRMDEETSRPYMYYEGIAQTNKGLMKLTIPKLELVLDSISIGTFVKENRTFLENFGIVSNSMAYKMTTEFIDVGKDTALYTLQFLDEEECKAVKEYFNDRYFPKYHEIKGE